VVALVDNLYWSVLDCFSSHAINALNFAKVIPLDNKFMIIIGGNNLPVFPSKVVSSDQPNIFLVDVITNQVYFQSKIINFRIFSACAKGEKTKIYFMGG
jgi:hypothetical protein